MTLIEIFDWFKANKLTLNFEKTNLMIFRANKMTQYFDLHVKTNTIKKSSVCKFLGVLIDENLS